MGKNKSAMEEKYGHISGGACGNKRVIKKFNKLYCNIYNYYGVTEEDIRNKSERYEELVHTLSCQEGKNMEEEY